MGNYLSCTLSTTKGITNQKGTKVVLPDATIHHVTTPATAAEMMLEAPGHLLVDVRAMHVGRRLSPLSADEDLETGHVYVALPIARVNSFVTAADVGRLMVAANKAVRRARILPDSPPPPVFPPSPVRLKLDESEVANEFKYRLSMCRSRRPTLETIAEESVCSRSDSSWLTKTKG